MKRMLSLLLVLSVSLVSFSQDVPMKFSLVKGGKYYHQTTGSVNVTQTIQGQPSKTSITISGKTSFLITDIVDTMYTADVKYDQLDMDMVTPMGSVKMSSEDTSRNDVFGKMMRGLISEPFSIDMTNKGKIVRARKIDSMIARMLSKFPELTSEQRMQVQNQMQQSYGEKAFMGSFNMLTSILPASGHAKKGDTWTTRIPLEAAMGAINETTYQLVTVADDYLLIHGEGKMYTLDQDAYQRISDMPVKYTLQGNTISDFKLSRTTGWIIEASILQVMSGDAEIKDNPKLPGGMKIPMSFRNVTSVKGAK